MIRRKNTATSNNNNNNNNTYRVVPTTTRCGELSCHTTAHGTLRLIQIESKHVM